MYCTCVAIGNCVSSVIERDLSERVIDVLQSIPVWWRKILFHLYVRVV